MYIENAGQDGDLNLCIILPTLKISFSLLGRNTSKPLVEW